MVIAATTGGSDGFDVKKLGVKKKWAVSGWKKILSEERYFVGAPFSHLWDDEKLWARHFLHLWEDEKLWARHFLIYEKMRNPRV